MLFLQNSSYPRFYRYNTFMHYYEVLLAAYQYRGADTLTYSSKDVLLVGMVVLVPMKNKNYAAIVTKEVTRPKFTTKLISKVLYDVPLPYTTMQLVDWLRTYYPSPASSIASLVLPANTVTKMTQLEALNTTKAPAHSTITMPALTEDQKRTLQTIEESKDSSFIIHGDTGSGKTRVYIEAILQVIRDNKSALVLTPEISLTPQLAQNIQRSVSAPVLVLHSNLTQKERRRLWEETLYSKSPLVIVGARSALFVPIRNLGLIVVDEFHDGAYKQDQSPYYSAIRVAGALAGIHHAKLFFGSATPPVTEYYIAKQKNVPILRMEQVATRRTSKTETTIKTINIRDRSNFTRSSNISNQLLDAISASIRSNEQSLVFLNRRGTARLISCQDCDWQATCPHCDLPLTYHGDTHIMRCHTCGYKAAPVVFCPKCASADISFKSIGTKALEAQLKKIYPDARIKRFDTDNLKSEKFSEQYQNILDGKIDIIVGTQMLVKGLDLPKLSVIGVVAADSSLYFPDFTAEEQTYQLLVQVMGRVTRGHRNGTIIIQTNDPSSATQIAAIDKDWDIFYSKQIEDRKKYLFPPFCYLLKLTVSRKSQKSAIAAAEKFCDQIKLLPIHAQIVGPTPRFNEKAGGNYNWQIVIKSKRRADLLRVISIVPANWSYDIDPTNLL